jgi:hypothetical protein
MRLPSLQTVESNRFFITARDNRVASERLLAKNSEKPVGLCSAKAITTLYAERLVLFYSLTRLILQSMNYG